MVNKRIIVRLELTAEAKDALVKLTDDAGMTQVAVASRLIEAASKLPKSVQAALLGHYPNEIESDVAKMILKHYAKLA